MTVFIVVSAAESQAANAAARSPGVTWCRFDNETVLWKPEAGALPRELHRELRLLGGPPQAAQGDLYLVVQAGNAFLHEFPDARVAVNKGRYLAVDMTAGERDHVLQHGGACFGLCPLPTNTTVLETLVPAGGERQPDPGVAALTAMVSQPRLADTMSRLTAFRTRHSLTAEFSAAADACKGMLEALGCAVAKRPITVGNGTSFNIVADKAGFGVNRRLVLVTAHLDSVNSAGGITAAAPGADDNGSGVAGVLEIARILTAQPAEHDVRFILFGGEEQGLHGSRQYVAALPQAERARIDSVINMDMIGTLNTQALTVLLEGASVSQALMNDLIAAAADYTSLTVQTSLNPFASDHVPFIEASLPALLTIEGADSANHNIHTANDTPDRIHYGLAAEILKMNVAVAARRLGIRTAGGARANSSPVVSWGANRIDAFVLGSDRALYHKWWNGAAWGPSLTGYENMGGVCTSVPQVVAWGREPARRVRDRHRQRALPQVVERLGLGSVAHRLRAHGRRLPRRSARGVVGAGPARRIRDRHRPGAVPQVVERLGLGSLAHRLRADGRRLPRAARSGVVGTEPARRVRDRHRPGAVPQVVERLGLGTVAHRLRTPRRRVHVGAARGGVGTEPARRVRDRHRRGAVPQVVGRLGLGSVAHRL